MFEPSYYTDKELKNADFKSIGKNVSISKNCTIIGLSNISIGNNVRIDGYCTIIATGELNIGSYVHIGAYCALFAKYGITIKDFCGLSQGVKIYTGSDDYGGEYLTNPTIPAKYTSNKNRGKVILNKHVLIGSGSVILPNVTIGKGSSVGALSLVSMSLDKWGVYFGSPVKKIKNRSKKLLELEKQLYQKLKG